VQLQQVMMNLISNSIDAMKDVADARALSSSRGAPENEQLNGVRQPIPALGLPPQQAGQISTRSSPTKVHGTVWISISRSSLRSHSGRLCAYRQLAARAQVFHSFYPPKVEAHE